MRRRRTAVALTLALVLLLLATACRGGDGSAIPPPPTTAVSVTSPPDPPDLAGVAVASIQGRTTTTRVALTPGQAILSGQVVGPDGPVPGATVRVERLVGDSVGFVEIVTGPDGTWQAPAGPPPPDPTAPPTPPTTAPPVPQGLLGGRYRVRAWKTPDLSLTAPSLLYLGVAEKKQLPIQLSRYSGLAVTSNVAPTPPIVGELVNIAILVTTRSVDPSGIVRALGVPAASLALLGGSGWQVVRSDGETDGGGRASFQLRCRAEGPQALGVEVNGTASFTLQVAPCAVAPPSTTTPPSTDPSGSTVVDPTTSTTAGPPRSTTSTRPTPTSRSTSTTQPPPAP